MGRLLLDRFDGLVRVSVSNLQDKDMKGKLQLTSRHFEAINVFDMEKGSVSRVCG